MKQIIDNGTSELEDKKYLITFLLYCFIFIFLKFNCLVQ